MNGIISSLQVEISNTWTHANTLSLITIVSSFIGAIFALYQWHVANKIRKSEYLDKLNLR